jgi:hypothetical protein
MLPQRLLRGPLSKGVGYLDHLSSRAPRIPLLLIRLAQGRMLHHHFVRATQTTASFVGILITLLENALRPGSLIRAKAPVRTTRTRARGRLFKSGREGSISLHLLIFPRVHQLWHVHSLSTTSLQLYYLILVHHIALLVQNSVKKWDLISVT